MQAGNCFFLRLVLCFNDGLTDYNNLKRQKIKREE